MAGNKKIARSKIQLVALKSYVNNNTVELSMIKRAFLLCIVLKRNLYKTQLN
jgi:hypothetical protein